MSGIQWVIFDLGGVFVEVVQSRTFERFHSLTGLSVPEVERRVSSDSFFNDLFISREFTPSEVTRHVNRTLGVSLSRSEVVDALHAELGEEISTTVEILPPLKRRTQVGCLSNTNSIHWDRLLASYPFMQNFDRRFASQLLGCAKPSREIYERTVDLLGVSPREILFFDDKSVNVESAQRLGWQARLYTDHEALVADLSAYNLW